MAWANNFDSSFGSQNMWPDGTPIRKQTPAMSFQPPGGRGGRGRGRGAGGGGGGGGAGGGRQYAVDRGAGGDDGRVYLKDLAAHMSNVVIVGIVIAKQKPRQVQSKANPGTDRSVFGFTLRDSPVDFINASCWGTSDHIMALTDKFKIGDVIEISNPQVQTKSNSEIEERCRPWTPSDYQLNVSERYSKLSPYDGWQAEPFGTLQHMPIRESSDYYTLGDVLANGRNLHCEHINLLSLVKKVGIPKDIVTKAGRATKRCEVTLFDDTCSSFSLVVWDDEVIDLIQQWEPRETVIFAVDVLAKFDDFRNTMATTVDSKSIFIINPDTREAHSLYKFGKSTPVGEEDDDDSSKDTIDLQNIRDIYTIDEIKTKIAAAGLGLPVQAEYGIVYAFLSAFDLDGPTSVVLSMRCSTCRWRVDKETGTCLNSNCSAALNDQSQAVLNYDLRISLSDLSGTIEGVYLGGNIAEQVVGYPVEEFSQSGEDKLTQSKWQHLLERCKVYFKLQARPGIVNGSGVSVRILQCEKADPQEAVTYMARKT